MTINRPSTWRARVWLWACVGLWASYPAMSYADLTGRYIAEDDPSIALLITENPDGSLSGSFEGFANALPLEARPAGSGFNGAVGGGSERMAVKIMADGDALTLVLAFDGATETQRFRRRPEAAVEEAAHAATSAMPAANSAAPSERDVVVNSWRLTDAELATIEHSYRVRIEDAAYWYDALSGAWGIEGGPTRGFIYSGLKIGGPLAADASGGGTDVFVNGRELHPLDVSGLRRCTQVNPGRYWVGADGVGGHEGGPPLFNLVSLCSGSAPGGRAGGWLCDGGGCAATRTVTGPYAVTSEGDGRAGVYTEQGLILTPN